MLHFGCLNQHSPICCGDMLCKYYDTWYPLWLVSPPCLICLMISLPYGSVSKPCTPSEPQNSWQMDVHPPKNGINRYWSIPISSNQVVYPDEQLNVPRAEPIRYPLSVPPLLVRSGEMIEIPRSEADFFAKFQWKNHQHLTLAAELWSFAMEKSWFQDIPSPFWRV